MSLNWIDIVKNENILKQFGKRLKKLRKQKRWAQKELAPKIDVHFQLLNKYDGGLHESPLEKLILMADSLSITVDYLLTSEESEGQPLFTHRLLERFRELEKFETEDQETVIKLIDAMIVKNRVEGALKIA